MSQGLGGRDRELALSERSVEQHRVRSTLRQQAAAGMDQHTASDDVHEGTPIGRQEIHGELLDPEEGGFVKRSSWKLWPIEKAMPKFHYIILSLDTAFTDETWDRKKQTGDPTAGRVWERVHAE